MATHRGAYRHLLHIRHPYTTIDLDQFHEF